MTDTTTDDSFESVHYEMDQDVEQNKEMYKALADTDTDDIYEAKYDVEIGTTVVADEANGSQQVMWRAEIIWTADDIDMEEVQYLAEHPAEAILGVVEEASGGMI
jgi:hypothetical protein